jgi:hypothetical protein
MDSQEAWAQVEAQGTIAPGTDGWWKVWGATWSHVRAGDLVLTKVDGEATPTLVADLFEAKAAPARVGIVTDDEQRVTFGALCPLVLLRRGTHNTLA